ncbi:unnamed protein product [Spodoptera exigua]|nr:unnamed protein product [Spodoptera exigua]
MAFGVPRALQRSYTPPQTGLIKADVQPALQAMRNKEQGPQPGANRTGVFLLSKRLTLPLVIPWARKVIKDHTSLKTKFFHNSFSFQNALHKKILREIRDAWEVTYTYTSPYSRASAYLVGGAMGYIMAMYKPADYRKTVSTTWSIFGIATSLGAMLVVLSLGYITKYREYCPLEAAVLVATNRIVWAAAICCIIGMCEYGTVPIIPNILGWSVFTPLSRLSYGIYMIHPIIVQRHKFALRSPHKFDVYGLAVRDLKMGGPMVGGNRAYVNRNETNAIVVLRRFSVVSLRLNRPIHPKAWSFLHLTKLISKVRLDFRHYVDIGDINRAKLRDVAVRGGATDQHHKSTLLQQVCSLFYICH